MDFETKQVWMVETNTDLTEGRGKQYPLCFTEIEATAIRLGLKKYVMGANAPITQITLYRIDDRWYGPVMLEPPTQGDLHQQDYLDRKEAVRSKAKEAGLSDEEIALLRQ